MRSVPQLPSLQRKFFALIICYSLLQLSIAPVAIAGGAKRPMPMKNAAQQGVRPQSGAPEGVFPNLDQLKRQQHSRPRAPQPMGSTARSRRKPLVPRNGIRVGDPFPIPSPIPSVIPTPLPSPRRGAASAGSAGIMPAMSAQHEPGGRLVFEGVMLRTLLAWNATPSLTVGLLPFSRADISANPGFDFFAMPPPQAGSSKVVFTSNRDGNAEIYSMNADGSSLTRLTNNEFNDDHPRWSPDGTKVLFQSDRDNPETGNADIYVMNANGTSQTRLTYDAADDSAAVWSPDGAKIVFQSLRNGQYYQVYVTNADGTNQVNTSNSFAADYQPSWSPNGAKIAFASERDSPTNFSLSSIYAMNADGTNQTRLTTSSEPFRDEQPAWSRDATKIAFVSTRDSVIETWQETDDEGGILNRSRVRTNKEVYKMNADGSNQIRLTNSLENDDSPSWSPDGGQLIFRSERERDAFDPTQQLWTMNADGTGQALINGNGFGDYSPSWNTSAANQSPIASPGGPYSGAVAQNVAVDGSASFDPDGSINNYAWTFGDGGTGSGAAPTHAYTSAGTYAITLTVTDNLGTQASTSTSATITTAGSEQYLTNFSLSALARPPSENESAYWNDILRAAFANGQDSLHLAIREMGKTLFESSEYASRSRTNQEYVYDLYKTYLMREPDASGLAFWVGVCNSYGRENVRRAFDESSEFAGIVATFTPSGSPSSAVSSFASARVDPFNQPGNGLASRDAEWSVPLLSLPGRAGLDLGLSLSYSSMVWTGSGPYIYFDEDNGWPSPGFRLGFPAIQEKFFDAQAGDNVYLLIGGSRVSLRQIGTSNVYEAADSSYLQLIDNGGSLLVRATDGTQLSYLKFNNEWRCTQIKDRNGNYITVNYNWLGHITTITDTLARVITFNYDSNQNLLSISQGWTVNGAPQTHNWATFGWATKTLQPSFSGAMVVGAPGPSGIPVLSQVGLHDGTRYTFEYNANGQVNPIRSYRSDNVERTYTAYDYDSPAADCPRLSETHTWAQNWTGINGVPQEVAKVYSDPGDGSHTVTTPDGTLYKEFYGGSAGFQPAGGWARGLVAQTEVWSGGVRQKWTTTNWTQDNTGVNYQTNPRVTETNVYDSAENRRRTTVSYASFTLPSGASCSLPSDTREYAADASTVLRRAHVDYRMDPVADLAYLNLHIIGLVKEQSLFEGNTSGETLMSKVGVAYDEVGSIEATDAPVQHDNSYDGNFVTGRGNLSSVKRYDVINSGQWTVSSMRYNTAGAVVSTKDPLNHEVTISYADSFSADGTNLDAPRSFSTLAFPTSITDADGFSSHVRYHYDLSAKTRVAGPPPANQSIGAIQVFVYDAAGRIDRVTTANNGAYQRFVYGPNYVQTFATVNTIADEAYSIQLFDGAGRVTGTASNHPNSIGGYSAQNTIYDLMGRAVKQSSPTEITGSWAPAGDDAAGWLFTQQAYNWQGKSLVTTNTDGTTKEATYSGCGCAGGGVVTLTDEGTMDAGVFKRRQQKIYSDVLGRTVKTELLNWQGGSVYSTVVNEYNARDQITSAKQYQGLESTGIYQESTMTYDGHGRLKTRHVPEQQVDPNNSSSTDHTTWDYNADNTVQKVTDARGASQEFTYNARHLVKRITYAGPAGDPNIPVPAPTEFEYDSAGNRLWMTDASGRVDYVYDSLSRMPSESRQFTGLSGTYTLGYEYALSGAVKKVTDQTAGTSHTSGFDNVGRISSVSTVGYGGGVTPFASQVDYRASGSVKSVAYGNNTNLSFGYNSRGLVSNFELTGVSVSSSLGSTPLPVSGAYQYYTDGGLKFAQDQGASNSIKDRAYQYDYAGRLKEAYSGTQARDYVNSTNLDTADGPYRQTSSYDVWNNVLSAGGRFWSRSVTEIASFNQSNRNPDWTYDAEGNLLSRNESFGDSLPSGHTYDAAGRMTSVTQTRPCWLEPQHLYQLHIYANTQTHDGDGQVTRYEQSHTTDLNGTHAPESPTKSYYLRSSVLGGRVISEYDGSDVQPQWTTTYVYAGNEWIGSISLMGASSSRNTWRVIDPVTGDEVLAGPGGEYNGQTLLDANGVDVGFADPFPPLGEEEGACVNYDPNYVDTRAHAFLNPFEGGANCIIDGIEQDCNSVGSEAAVRCNGPCTGYSPGANGGRGGILTFEAHADGYAGYLPRGARYVGGGYWIAPDASDNESEVQSHHASRLPQKPNPTVVNLVNDILANPDCQAFMKTVLNNASTRKNPVLEGGDIQKIFGDFLSQSKGGISRRRLPGSAGFGSPSGRIKAGGKGNANIHLPLLGANQDRNDAEGIVNELPHLSGGAGGWPDRNEYDDYALAQAVQGTPYTSLNTLPAAINPFDPDYPGRENRYDGQWSTYFHEILRKACGLKK